MSKLHIDEKNGRAWFACPGCDAPHSVIIEQKKNNQSPWVWNKLLDLPTLTPSILTYYVGSEVTAKNDHRCHSFITAGSIIFLSDCYHELKGKTVELPDFDEKYPNWQDGAGS